MDNKRLILAVAGSGKTFYIVQQLNDYERFLLITYTISGTDNLIREIIRRFGYVPDNIKVVNYFSFLYSFCFKPFFKDELNPSGIAWNRRPSIYDKSYKTKSGYLYYNRISKLVLDRASKHIVNRLEKYFDQVMVDEIQDFAGNDFNLIMHLVKGNLKILMVGDFYQHTFDTSRDGPTNKTLYDNYDKYIDRFKKAGIGVDTTTLIKSRRCSTAACDFIKSRLGVDIESQYNKTGECRLVTDENEAEAIYRNNSVVKLFLLKHYDYKCRSDNWGACKGLTFTDVCVVVNDEILKIFNPKVPVSIKPGTKSKLYVACSRASKNLYFVSDKLFKRFI